MDSKQETLIITMEECGELIQACSKVQRHENDPAKYAKWVQSLREEAGDVLAMIDILVEQGLLDRTELLKRIDVKKSKLRKFSNIFS